jgi:hypothetical protein
VGYLGIIMFKTFIAIVVAALLIPALASLVQFRGPHFDSTREIARSTADATALTPAEKVPPIPTETAGSKSVVDQSQIENGGPKADTMFSQFQAWAAAQKDSEAPAQTVAAAPKENEAPAQSVQDVPAKVVPDAPKQAQQPSSIAQKRREARPVVDRHEATKRIPRRPPQPLQSAQGPVQGPAQLTQSLQVESQPSPRSR